MSSGHRSSGSLCAGPKSCDQSKGEADPIECTPSYSSGRTNPCPERCPHASVHTGKSINPPKDSHVTIAAVSGHTAGHLRPRLLVISMNNGELPQGFDVAGRACPSRQHTACHFNLDVL